MRERRTMKKKHTKETSILWFYIFSRWNAACSIDASTNRLQWLRNCCKSTRQCNLFFVFICWTPYAIILSTEIVDLIFSDHVIAYIPYLEEIAVMPYLRIFPIVLVVYSNIRSAANRPPPLPVRSMKFFNANACLAVQLLRTWIYCIFDTRSGRLADFALDCYHFCSIFPSFRGNHDDACPFLSTCACPCLSPKRMTTLLANNLFNFSSLFFCLCGGACRSVELCLRVI